MKVTIDIPDRDWFTLAGRAENANVRMPDLIITAVHGLLEDSPRRATIADRVRELVDHGIPDPVIAHRLQTPVEYVRVVRRRLGLRAVRFRREQWEQELAA